MSVTASRPPKAAAPQLPSEMGRTAESVFTVESEAATTDAAIGRVR